MCYPSPFQVSSVLHWSTLSYWQCLWFALVAVLLVTEADTEFHCRFLDFVYLKGVLKFEGDHVLYFAEQDVDGFLR